MHDIQKPTRHLHHFHRETFFISKSLLRQQLLEMIRNFYHWGINTKQHPFFHHSAFDLQKKWAPFRLRFPAASLLSCTPLSICPPDGFLQVMPQSRKMLWTWSHTRANRVNINIFDTLLRSHHYLHIPTCVGRHSGGKGTLKFRAERIHG